MQVWLDGEVHCSFHYFYIYICYIICPANTPDEDQDVWETLINHIFPSYNERSAGRFVPFLLHFSHVEQGRVVLQELLHFSYYLTSMGSYSYP